MSRQKELSQHYLISHKYLERLIEFVNPLSTDIIVEIGPGKGAFSTHLAKKCKKLFLVEKDILLIKQLHTLFSTEKNVIIINTDILSTPLKKISAEPVLLFSNLPFSITTEFLVYLVMNRDLINRAVVVFQKEVAERLVAAAGTQAYAWQSVWIQCFFHVQAGPSIPPSAFKPRPSVVSTSLQLVPRLERRCVKREKAFLRFIRMLFKHRKKKLSNALPKDIKEALLQRNALWKKRLNERVYKFTPEDLWTIFNLRFTSPGEEGESA